MSENTIFIQIAAYRDPELLPTLKHCLENAKYPENLYFGIAWQHDSTDVWDNLDEYKDNSHFRIIDIPHVESKGVCWARNQVQQLYNGERYTLQLDSHHRFTPNWDEVLIEMIEDLHSDGYAAPLLTAYIPSYDPDNDPEARVQEPWWLTFDRFIPEGAIFFLPATIPGWQMLDRPVRGRFYSAHFCFTLGRFATEVQHDPEYYFHGEEISIAVRAYTHGYDIFHPHKVVIWHEYTRKGRTKHWDDNAGTWGAANDSSHLRNRILFGMDGHCPCELNFGKYGFGHVRSLTQYEAYAGVKFNTRGVQEYTLKNNFAPNPPIANAVEYINSFNQVFKHCIDLYPSQLPYRDYEFWAVAFEDENGNDIIRLDADRDEVNRILGSNEPYYQLWREFTPTKQPKSWTVWPLSASQGWCDKITGRL